ncbi:MAG: hypothetical protein LW645_16480 [Verrucomicrobiaceae bacterium]|nr:hypothetical protein [Verrucomicrobiaceae bacterium]
MPPGTLEELEERLSRPTPAVVDLMQALPGDIIILGAAGKMGPSLARMAKRASDEAGTKRRIIAVSRFSTPGSAEEFQQHGIETIAVDLLAANAVAYLPHVANVVFMAGMKFGSTGQEPMTWAMNAWLPGLECERYHRSRIAAFSTGNVYGLVPVERGGSHEEDTPNPAGEYAMSCLGRERIFQHFSQTRGTPVSLIRLNYACDLRYGVLVDVAQKVWKGQPETRADRRPRSPRRPPEQSLPQFRRARHPVHPRRGIDGMGRELDLTWRRIARQADAL